MKVKDIFIEAKNCVTIVILIVNERQKNGLFSPSIVKE